MTAGSKWQLFIPPRLAYGARGNGRTIGPNAALIFDVELVEVKSKDLTNSSAQDTQSADLADIVVSFKLDPSLIGGSYAQPGWIAPQIYQGISGQDAVEAKADGLDAEGRPVMGIKAEWIPEDPAMVMVSAGGENSVKILIRGPGQSNLKVVSGDISKTLSIKATSENDVLRIEISQL